MCSAMKMNGCRHLKRMLYFLMQVDTQHDLSDENSCVIAQCKKTNINGPNAKDYIKPSEQKKN